MAVNSVSFSPKNINTATQGRVLCRWHWIFFTKTQKRCFTTTGTKQKIAFHEPLYCVSNARKCKTFWLIKLLITLTGKGNWIVKICYKTEKVIVKKRKRRCYKREEAENGWISGAGGSSACLPTLSSMNTRRWFRRRYTRICTVQLYTLYQPKIVSQWWILPVELHTYWFIS